MFPTGNINIFAPFWLISIKFCKLMRIGPSDAKKLKFSELLEVHQEFPIGELSPPFFPSPVRSRVPLKPARGFGGAL